MMFSVKKERKNALHHIPFLVLILLLVFMFYFTDYLSGSNNKYNKQVLEDALTRSITQCYALEGMYPPSLDYLVDNYGLTYDHEHFFVDYTYIGSNLRPDVTIIEKN